LTFLSKLEGSAGLIAAFCLVKGFGIYFSIDFSITFSEKVFGCF
jgi:hypothetical protein